ncbi:unnamed protein product [Cunninghamella echinulata]
MQIWMNIMNILDTYLVSNKSQENHNSDNNNNNENSNIGKQTQEYNNNNNNILKEKRSIQQGINLLQLAMDETDGNTCLTLYELAMEKLNSINHPAVYSNTSNSNSNSNNAYQYDDVDDSDQQYQYTRSIWAQSLIIMAELVNLFIIILQLIPIPDLFIKMTSSVYCYITFIEKKHHILQYICTQMIYGLYFIINKCQQYDLPKYISYLIYIFVIFSIKLMKILIESIHLENQNQYHHQHYHTIK